MTIVIHNAQDQLDAIRAVATQFHENTKQNNMLPSEAGRVGFTAVEKILGMSWDRSQEAVAARQARFGSEGVIRAYQVPGASAESDLARIREHVERSYYEFDTAQASEAIGINPRAFERIRTVIGMQQAPGASTAVAI